MKLLSHILNRLHVKLEFPSVFVTDWKRKLLSEIEAQQAADVPLTDIVRYLDQQCAQLHRKAEGLGKGAVHSDRQLNAHTATMKRAQFIDQQRGQLYQVMVGRNLKGQELERAGQVDEAIVLYEANLRDQFDDAYPYDRLRIIYTRRQDYRNAIRACRAYLSLPDGTVGHDKARFRYQLEKLLAR